MRTMRTLILKNFVMVINMFFRLNPECYFIRGKKLGTIYDLIDGNIHVLNEEETKLLTSAENNNIIEKSEFFKGLKDQCLGDYYDSPPYIQKLRLGPRNMYDDLDAPPKLFKAFIEINNSCDQNCWFCGFNGIKRTLGCIGCNIWGEKDSPMDISLIKTLIDDLSALNCSSLFLKGGDLTKDWERTNHVINHACGKFENLFLTLNEKNCSEKHLNQLKGKVIIILQVEDLNDIQKYGEDVFFLLISTGDEKIINNYPDKRIEVDLVGDDKTNLVKNKLNQELSTNLFQFTNNLIYHPCLGNSLTITHNGNLIPCAMLRSYVFGNIKKMRIYDIFQEKKEDIDKIWKMNLDELEKCTNCEFRYVCMDCRALEIHQTGKIRGKELCNYEPSTGKWDL